MAKLGMVLVWETRLKLLRRATLTKSIKMLANHRCWFVREVERDAAMTLTLAITDTGGTFH